MIESTPTVELLTRAIEASALRQSVYSTNIANAQVDGYRRLEVSFDQALARSGVSLGGSSEDLRLALTTQAAPSIVSTGETVRLDQEMGLMAKNALRYQVLMSAYEKSMGSLQLAISEGRQ